MKIFATLALVLFSTNALAVKPLVKVTGDDLSISNIHDCMVAGWAAAEATPEQADQAKILMDNLHTFINDRIESVESLKRNVMAAWIRHPISLNEVNSAKSDLEMAVIPIRNEITTTSVTVINILTVSQRGKFDKAFFSCMNQ